MVKSKRVKSSDRPAEVQAAMLARAAAKRERRQARNLRVAAIQPADRTPIGWRMTPVSKGRSRPWPMFHLRHWHSWLYPLGLGSPEERRTRGAYL
jgi:hypothetical protein